MMKNKQALALVAAFALLAAGPAAFAQSGGSAEEGQWSLGFYAGTYAPGPDELEDQTTFGARVGYSLSPHAFVSASLGRISTEVENLPSGVSGSFDVDFTLLDLSGGYVFGKPEKRFRFSLLGGIGGAWASADGSLSAGGVTVSFDDASADSFTAHAGMGPIIRLTERTALRLLTRFRWFEAREEDNVDREITLGFGFRLGS